MSEPIRRRPRHPIDHSARLGRVVQHLRSERGMSQETLADLAALDRTYVSMLERGLHRVSLEIAAAIAQALDVSLPELITRIEDERPEHPHE